MNYTCKFSENGRPSSVHGSLVKFYISSLLYFSLLTFYPLLISSFLLNYCFLQFCRKWSSNSSSSSSQSTVQPVITNTIVTPAPESPTVDNSSQNAEVTDGEWTYDPNEPRYCLCNQVSYGDMVACDNEDVSIFVIFNMIWNNLQVN